mmetsp:Transcript_30345/g.38928  ORF Transcript_30345/g.38928 Transcript_30345/m.38928 type:complete len:87 (+) Transcript_30345:285-545(+)
MEALGVYKTYRSNQTLILLFDSDINQTLESSSEASNFWQMIKSQKMCFSKFMMYVSVLRIPIAVPENKKRKRFGGWKVVNQSRLSL